jgi:hypothetical protein
MRAALRFARLPALLTVVAIASVVLLTGRAELILRLYVLALAAVALIHLVRAVRAAHPPRARSPFDSALRRKKRRQERLPQLERIEREVTHGLATAIDLHYRLRPSLRRTASELLASHRGIDLDASPEAARAALGERTWEIVRRDRKAPDDRSAPGLDLASLRSVVASLEAL